MNKMKVNKRAMLSIRNKAKLKKKMKKVKENGVDHQSRSARQMPDTNGEMNFEIQQIQNVRQKSDINGELNFENVGEEEGENNVDQLKTAEDSVKQGHDSFKWLIAPISPREFFEKAWEKAPIHVKRTNLPDYYRQVLSTDRINHILKDNYILFGKNIDVTSYRDGQRETHNPPGRAIPSVVWDFYKQGCSIRMLNPQTFSPDLGRLNASLQEFFGCFVGANSYLTPPNSQGFAPHYDDIEAFILQIEGKKHWKVYQPRSPEEVLPRFSSGNFSQDEIGQPVLEVTLSAGDLLYFPRGFIHQASTEPGWHSLHVTVSCYQRNSWGDLLEKLLPASLAVALEEDVDFRQGLPLGYLRHTGVSNSESNSRERTEFFEHLSSLMSRLASYAPVDAAVDQMGKQFMHDALPPYLTPEETNCSVHSSELMKLKRKGQVSGNIALKETSRVRLTRAYILRLVKEDDTSDNVQVYHCADNSLEYHGEDAQTFEVSADAALAIEMLISEYPHYTAVADLSMNTTEEKLELANTLWMKGLLITEQPLRS